jgi:hypothetical protein
MQQRVAMSAMLEERMTDTSGAEARQFVLDGRAAALAGDTYAARTAFRRATELDPTSVDAWLGLSSAVPILSEKREHLRQALAIASDHQEALASLAYVERLIGQGLQLAPAQRLQERHASGDASPLLSAPEPVVTPEVEYCYRHPTRETGLHCVQCGRPICAECATMTAVGQICPDDRRARRPTNYKVSAGDVLLGGLVALFASAVVALPLALFVGRLGFFAWIIVFMVGPAIAEFIVRVVDRVTKTKRGRPIQITVGVAMALGTLPFALFNPLIVLLYLVLATTTAVTRLR